jgi:hypothetical protein
MSKLIGLLILLVAVFCGWKLFNYYAAEEKDQRSQQERTAALNVVPEQLSGLPQNLEASYAAAKDQYSTLKAWIKLHAAQVQDPRRASIELDYCSMLARENPAEARRVFASVKERTGPTSPIWGRVKSMEKSFQ